MKLTMPFNIGVTGRTTVELSLANDEEARDVGKLLERNDIVCTIDGHWLQAEADWTAVLEILRGAETT